MKNISQIVNEKLKINSKLKQDLIYCKDDYDLRSIIYDRYEENPTYLDLTDVDVSEVDSMGELFQNYPKVKIIDITGWDTHNVTDMSHMFNDCLLLTEIKGIENLNVENVEHMDNMFSYLKYIKKLDLTNWKPKKCKDMSYMFFECNQLKSVGNIGSWPIFSLQNCKSMFAYCVNLNVDLTQWNLKKINNKIDSLNIDFATSNVKLL